MGNTDMSRKRKQISPDVQLERDERRKARNRIAARKCRDKRNNRVRQLEDEKCRQLETNGKLLGENGKLRAEIERIKVNYVRMNHVKNEPCEEEEDDQLDEFHLVNNNEPELEGFNDILANPDEILASNNIFTAMCE